MVHPQSNMSQFRSDIIEINKRTPRKIRKKHTLLPQNAIVCTCVHRRRAGQIAKPVKMNGKKNLKNK